MINKVENISQWWFVCVVWCHPLKNVSFLGWHFPAFYSLYQKKFSCCQSWWQPLVRTSLISQLQENVKKMSTLNWELNDWMSVISQMGNNMWFLYKFWLRKNKTLEGTSTFVAPNPSTPWPWRVTANLNLTCKNISLKQNTSSC